MQSAPHVQKKMPSVRSRRSARNYCAGQAAERSVERHYRRAGMRCLARRWRGASGEVDLIFDDGSSVIFVEVKASATHGQARGRVSRTQMRRIMGCGSEYVGRLPRGQLTPMRFDLATVNATGDVQLIENAFFGA